MRHPVCCLLAFGVLAGYASAQENLVTLTMTERAGVARKGEYVTFGVPLPKGRVKSVDRLRLLHKGKPVIAEILPVTKWWDDGSLRWVHLLFKTDCPAKAARKFTLALAPAAAKIRPAIKVLEHAGGIVVQTGGLSFEVNKKNFNVINIASVRPPGARPEVAQSPVIVPHRRGLGVKVGGEEYLAGLDPGVKVKVEERGPLHAVIHAAGAFKNKAGRRKFDFDCRIYAYAGSPNVRVVTTILNRQGRMDQPIPLGAYFIELPTTVRSGECVFGSETGPSAGRLRGRDAEAFIYQSTSDSYSLGGVLKGRGRGKSTKMTATGWGGTWSDTRGLAAGIRWFWQMHPTSVEVNGGGLVRVGLYPERHGRPRDIYPGVARTHEVTLAFGAQTPGDLSGAFAVLQRPLTLFAPPRWYCRDTQSLGDFCEAGGQELYGEFTEQVRRFDQAFEQANRRCQTFRDSRINNGITRDSYGFLAYGDGMHHVWTNGVDVPENIAWAGNYYGYPHMMCVQFIRTGNVEYFDNFAAHALHTADVHTVHYAAERRHLVGACRYCPPTDHVRGDPSNSRDYRTARVYISETFCHHKVAGIIDRWYFLRDHRCRDVANLILDHTFNYTGADNNFGQPRAPGFILNFCADAYDLYGNRQRWVRRGQNVLRLHRRRNLRLTFQAGVFLEGMRRYYELSGNNDAYEYIRRTCDRILAGGGRGGNTSVAMSFMYRRTGEARYLAMALRGLPQRGVFGNPWKDFALQMHSGAICIADLHHIAQARRKAGRD